MGHLSKRCGYTLYQSETRYVNEKLRVRKKRRPVLERCQCLEIGSVRVKHNVAIGIYKRHISAYSLVNKCALFANVYVTVSGLPGNVGEDHLTDLSPRTGSKNAH